MIELKAYRFITTDELFPEANAGSLYYDKSETDKAIEEKDKEIDSLKNSIGKLLNAKTEQVMDEVFQRCIIYGDGFVPVEHAMKLTAELSHNNKRERCLNNAWFCKKLSKECALAAYTHRGCLIDRHFYNKSELYLKWRKRWLALADKYKEGNV